MTHTTATRRGVSLRGQLVGIATPPAAEQSRHTAWFAAYCNDAQGPSAPDMGSPPTG